MSPFGTPKRVVASAVGAALAAGSLAALAITPAAHAAIDGSGVVISEVYAGGGTDGTGQSYPSGVFDHDFVELFNPTDTAIDLDGYAVQYGSATNTSGNFGSSSMVTLTGSIPAGGHYLIEYGSAGTVGADLPEADASNSQNLQYASAVVVLTKIGSGQTVPQTLAGVPVGNITDYVDANGTIVVDAVGYGTANKFETANLGTVLDNNLSASRDALGTDTNNNAADFTISTDVSPVNSAGETRQVDIQVLGTNDFHGRLVTELGNGYAGAAGLAGAVNELRTENPNTAFVAAGDLIGASTFESFIQQDKPTIDALNAAGLDVSAAGNHEFDQGYDDLINRVMAPYDAVDNEFGGAEWEYVAANVVMKDSGDPALEPSYVMPLGGVNVGFVGAVTEDLPTLVSPDGIASIEVKSIVDSVNAEADELKSSGAADIVIMLVHEGSPSTSCDVQDDEGTVWGDIVNGIDDNVDAIISGHTHLAYNCTINGRPVVSAGQYGMNLNQLNISYDPIAQEITNVDQNLIQLVTPDPDGSGPLTATLAYPADDDVAEIVTDAVSAADVLGAAPLGELGGAFNRAKLSNGTTENRGGESTLGNLVAEAQRWATDTPETGSAQIAFMNPGGLRQDMVGTDGGTGYPRTLTYKQAAVVQPFANTLVNMDLTGAQIKTVLEQQWQRTSAGAVATRPFLRLGTSAGFTYTYTESPVNVGGTDTFEGTVTGMWLNGEPIDLAATYSVTVNSFLAAGGDNFRELANGTSKADTGKVDLTAMVDYMAQFAPAGTPLAVDYAQHAVRVEFDASAPDSYQVGDTVTFNVGSLAMSAPGDVTDSSLDVVLGGEVIGTAAVDNTVSDAVYDQNGTATVSFTVPAGTPVGAAELTLVGSATGTSFVVPITIAETPVAAKSVIKAKNFKLKATPKPLKAKKAWKLTVTLKATPKTAVKGKVTVKIGKKTFTAKVKKGKAVFKNLPKQTKGKKKFTVKYLGSSTVKKASKKITLTFK